MPLNIIDTIKQIQTGKLRQRLESSVVALLREYPAL